MQTTTITADGIESMTDTINRLEAIKGKLRNRYNKPGSIKFNKPLKPHALKVDADRVKAIDEEEYKQAARKLYSRSWLLVNLANLFPKHTSKTGTLWLIINNSKRIMYSLPLLRHLLKRVYQNNYYVTDEGKLRRKANSKKPISLSNGKLYNTLVALEKTEPDAKLTWKQRNILREACDGARIIGQQINRVENPTAMAGPTYYVQFRGETHFVDPMETDLDSPQWIGRDGMQYLAEMIDGTISRSVNRARHAKAVRYFRRIFSDQTK
jgi:hypothetical protein